MSKTRSLILLIVIGAVGTAFAYYRLSMTNCEYSPQSCALAREKTMNLFYIMVPVLWAVLLLKWHIRYRHK